MKARSWIDEEFLEEQKKAEQKKVEYHLIRERNLTTGKTSFHFIRKESKDVRDEQRECIHLYGPHIQRLRLYRFYKRHYGRKYRELLGKKSVIKYCSLCRKLMEWPEYLDAEQGELLQFHLDLEWRPSKIVNQTLDDLIGSLYGQVSAGERESATNRVRH